MSGSSMARNGLLCQGPQMAHLLHINCRAVRTALRTCQESDLWPYACQEGALATEKSTLPLLDKWKLCILFWGGLHPAMYKAYSWFCAQASLLEGLGNYMKYQGSNLDQQCARQIPYLLYYCSSPKFCTFLDHGTYCFSLKFFKPFFTWSESWSNRIGFWELFNLKWKHMCWSVRFSTCSAW